MVPVVIPVSEMVYDKATDVWIPVSADSVPLPSPVKYLQLMHANTDLTSATDAPVTDVTIIASLPKPVTVPAVLAVSSNYFSRVACNCLLIVAVTIVPVG